jgi:hypothetical protein
MENIEGRLTDPGGAGTMSRIELLGESVPSLGGGTPAHPGASDYSLGIFHEVVWGKV